MSAKRQPTKTVDLRTFEIPCNWELCFDLERELAWYEVGGRVLTSPSRAYAFELKRAHPSSGSARNRAIELCRSLDWDLEARWNWFRTKWADLFEGEDSPGCLLGSMGLMFRLPNGGHAHLCGRSPEETDRDIEGFRMMFGGDGMVQPRPAETPFDNINLPLFRDP